MRNPKPTDYRFSLDFDYGEDMITEGEESDNAPEEVMERRRLRNARQRNNHRSFGQYVSLFFLKIWYTIKLIVTLGGSIAPVGTEQQEFDSGEAIINDERLLAALELKQDTKFFKTCTYCRKKKKPFLLLVLTNPDDQ